MWPFISQVNLIRYLIVWRVNGSFVQLPRCLSVDISQTLGTLIAERLPTPQARPWRKALAAWGKAEELLAGERSDEAQAASGPKRSAKTRPRPPQGPREAPGQIPAPTLDTLWPIEAVLWPYPVKRAYGQGEPILWELKLLGNDADHGLFLEVILPAMEEAATTSDERWHRPRTLWGRFDIQAIYAARGPRWEPVVQAGRLDLKYRATPMQWAEELSFTREAGPPLHNLTWLTPYDFKSQTAHLAVQDIADRRSDTALTNPKSEMSVTEEHAARNSKSNAPSLSDLLDALMARMTLFQAGKRPTPEQVWALLTPQEQQALRLDCEKGSLRRQKIECAPKGWPGCWIGTQMFTVIPAGVVPYLELASILHIGRQTHFGCGTFVLS